MNTFFHGEHNVRECLNVIYSKRESYQEESAHPILMQHAIKEETCNHFLVTNIDTVITDIS
jgi:hypothetical protein